MEKKKLNIYVYFVIMLLAYFLFEEISKYVPSFIGYGIIYGKYGRYFISELSWLILILFIVYCTNNSSVLGEKKEGFFKTLLVGLPMFIYSIVLTSTNISNLLHARIYDIISLVLYCLAIGLAEELMCRGWILNSFLTRYGDKRKNAILSIIFSALIFGGMHITNIWYGGQTLAETLIQILFATAAGIYFGSIFYRTKNILAIAFLHAFYDFSLMANDINLLKDCTSNDNFKVLLYSLTLNIVISLILVIAGFVVIRKSKMVSNKEKIDKEQFEQDDKFKKIAVVLSIAIYAITINLAPVLYNITNKDFDESETCYKYEDIYLHDVETNYNNYESYDITEKIKIYKDKNILLLTYQNDKYELANEINDFKVIDNSDKYLVIYTIGETNSSDSIAYYSDYLKKDSIKEEKSYIDEFVKSFKEYKMPALNSIGQIKDRNDNYYYPLLKDYNDNLFMIDNKNNIRHIIIDKAKVSDLEVDRLNRENEELSKKLIYYIPFINFKNIEYTDVYHEVNSKVEELDIKVLYSFAFLRSNQEYLSIPLDLSVCEDLGPCMGNSYVKEEELNNKLLMMFGKSPELITNFDYANGFVEKADNYYVYINKTEDPTIEKISKIVNYKKVDNYFIIEEVAGFIYGNTISKYSDIDDSIVTTKDSKEELKEFFNNNMKEFVTFKHTFIYNKEIDSYNYSETIVEKNS